MWLICNYYTATKHQLPTQMSSSNEAIHFQWAKSISIANLLKIWKINYKWNVTAKLRQKSLLRKWRSELTQRKKERETKCKSKMKMRKKSDALCDGCFWVETDTKETIQEVALSVFSFLVVVCLFVCFDIKDMPCHTMYVIFLYFELLQLHLPSWLHYYYCWCK